MPVLKVKDPYLIVLDEHTDDNWVFQTKTDTQGGCCWHAYMHKDEDKFSGWSRRVDCNMRPGYIRIIATKENYEDSNQIIYTLFENTIKKGYHKL